MSTISILPLRTKGMQLWVILTTKIRSNFLVGSPLVLAQSSAAFGRAPYALSDSCPTFIAVRDLGASPAIP